MKPSNLNGNLSVISKNRLFVGSGVEDGVDAGVSTRLDEFGQYHIDYKNCTNVDAVSRVTLNLATGDDIETLASSIFSKIRGIKHNNCIGHYLGLFVGYADPQGFRRAGSSGGMVSWLATELMARGEIDGFIHVKRSTAEDGRLFQYGISRTIGEIRNGAKSRYYPCELSQVLKEVREKPGRYAVVGIPEIITELRMLANEDETIGQRIKYYFGLVCGHQKTTKYAEALAWEYGIAPGDLADIDFRVKRSHGSAIDYDIRISGKAGGKDKTYIIGSRDPFVSSWAHGFFKARFSDFTDDSFNELADITFGDAWLDEYVGDSRGNNILIVRQPELQKILKKAAASKQIKLDTVTEEAIARSQEGLIHHTRDELPYRLYKERSNTGWAPEKRVEPDSKLARHRKKVQDVRQTIAEDSHIHYAEAVRRGDFEYFRNKMLGHVNKYRKLYKQPELKRTKRLDVDGAILTLTGYRNYGNIIQRYALQEFLRQQGYNFLSLVEEYTTQNAQYTMSRVIALKTPLRFIKRIIKRQRPYWHIPSVGEVYPEASTTAALIEFVNENIAIRKYEPNEIYDTYIVGSDQVWRDWWDNREPVGYYFLDFLRGRKANRIAYAASFGKDKIEEVLKPEDVEYIQPYIEDFDSISVREKSGIAMIKGAWGIKDVTEVVDPTLLLEASVYSSLIDKSKVKDQEIKPIFTYILGETPEVVDFVEKIERTKGWGATKIRAHEGSENDILPPVELWLKGFRDAELVVTNSFHGMMFSVINNTDFIIIGKEVGGLSRVKDFLSKYGLTDRFVEESEIGNFKVEKLADIEWGEVNKKLEKARKDSGEWLLSSVKKTV